MGMLEYLLRIAKGFCCSEQCLVISLIYIDRLVQARPEIVVSPWSVHRLCLTSIVLAAKFWDDDFYTNSHYAKIGGVMVQELMALETTFLALLGWRLYVSPEEYGVYHDHVLTVQRQRFAAASSQTCPGVRPTTRPRRRHARQREMGRCEEDIHNRRVGKGKEMIASGTHACNQSGRDALAKYGGALRSSEDVLCSSTCTCERASDDATVSHIEALLAAAEAQVPNIKVEASVERVENSQS
jgi:hypothetical protein